MVLIMVSFSNCSSAQKLQKDPPVTIKNAYYQNWVAGVKGGGSGINLFIEIDDYSKSDIQFDSIFFRGKMSKIETKPDNPNLLIGRFSLSTNQQEDIIMSNEPFAEYGNEIPKNKSKIPFELNANECVVSYKDKAKTKYFKLEKIKGIQALNYPSAPPKKH